MARLAVSELVSSRHIAAARAPCQRGGSEEPPAEGLAFLGQHVASAAEVPARHRIQIVTGLVHELDASRAQLAETVAIATFQGEEQAGIDELSNPNGVSSAAQRLMDRLQSS